MKFKTTTMAAVAAAALPAITTGASHGNLSNAMAGEAEAVSPIYQHGRVNRV